MPMPLPPDSVLRDSGKPIPVDGHEELRISDSALRIGCSVFLAIAAKRPPSEANLNQM